MPDSVEGILLYFVLPIAFAFGLLIGSFLNVVIYRLPQTLFASWRNECREFLAGEHAGEHTPEPLEKEVFNIAFPRSHCPKCKALVKAWQNIPIVSYILLRGKCANCQTPISVRYPIIELLTGLLTVFVISQFDVTWAGLLALVFTWSLIALTMIDVDHQLLPDDITLPLLWLGLLANACGVFTSLESAVYGAVAGYLSLWSIYWLFKLLTHKEGMGYGDFKLLAALGAWMGWQSLPLIVILSSFVGAFIGIGGILIFGKDKNKPIPFGPYLAIAGWIAFFWGETLVAGYLQIVRVG